MTKQTFTMSAHALRYLAEASLAAIDKTEWATPILLAAHFEVEKGRVRALATDRYRVHEAFAETKKAAKPHELLIHHSELSWVVTTMRQNRKAFGGHDPVATVVTEFADEKAATVTITISGGDLALSRTAKTVAGNFPPVWKLLDQARAAEISSEPKLLKLAFLNKARALSLDGAETPRLTFTKGTNPNKPGVVILDFENAGKVYATALIQPNLDVFPRKPEVSE
ncbi:hypothetical protein [Gryllotalpicola koreensis]|uniref:DNA polymerase III beta sliding clamp central domain-containing protein n=1 Tax=Gryllotalpicola koreensis TaxID=993086 RepID=A0ABP8A320_9MICO